jgi:GT2 family glycosyltransferase
MLHPKVAIIWINFNSMHIWSYVEESLKAVASLEYPNYEIILVDSGSFDGSKEAIEDWLIRRKTDIPVKFIKLKKNLGFTGAANIGYKYRDKNVKYVALVNNDCVPNKNSLSALISYLEKHEDVGAIQGVITKVVGKREVIDSGGSFLDELLFAKIFHEGEPPNKITTVTYVTYVEGTMPIYRVEAVEKAMDGKGLFISEAFVYWLEDCLLGLRLWNHSYKSVTLPKIVGFHYRRGTIKKYGHSINVSYFSLRNWFALWILTNSRFKAVLPLVMFTIQIKKILKKEEGFLPGVLASGVSNSIGSIRWLIKAVIDGLRLGMRLRKDLGFTDIYKAPILPSNPTRA